MNKVRDYRDAAAWSQLELANRCGLPRATVSAIEIDRMTPSVHTAMALARAFSCRVEDLFLTEPEAQPVRWLDTAPNGACRVWLARVGDVTVACPAETTHCGEIPHDALWDGRSLELSPNTQPDRTLLMAGCDPAAALLARQLSASGVRAIPLIRPSGEALELLERGVVHVAGIHPTPSRCKRGLALLPLFRWHTGVAVGPRTGIRRVSEALHRECTWIMRQPGSGAQRGLDALFAEHGHLPSKRARIAPDHRSVAIAVRLGYVDAGFCIQLAAVEAGLDFLGVREERYDLCMAQGFESDPRGSALRDAIHCQPFRKALAALPGYTLVDN